MLSACCAEPVSAPATLISIASALLERRPDVATAERQVVDIPTRRPVASVSLIQDLGSGWERVPAAIFPGLKTLSERIRTQGTFLNSLILITIDWHAIGDVMQVNVLCGSDVVAVCAGARSEVNSHAACGAAVDGNGVMDRLAARLIGDSTSVRACGVLPRAGGSTLPDQPHILRPQPLFGRRRAKSFAQDLTIGNKHWGGAEQQGDEQHGATNDEAPHHEMILNQFRLKALVHGNSFEDD
jgi:hypothetical protein